MTGDGALVMTVRGETPITARIFAAAVEHCRTLVPDLRLVVVDDCSPDPLMQEQLKAWDAMKGVSVIRMGPPVQNGYYQRTGLAAGQPTSYGHAPTLDRGLWYVHRHLGRSWAFCLDGDVILLAHDVARMIADAVALLDERTVVAGEWVGTPTRWAEGQHWAGVRHHTHTTKDATTTIDKAREPVPAAIRAYGYVNMMCSAVNLEEFWAPRAHALQNTGWVANQWFYSQMARGKRAAYVPFFRARAAAHIGGVAVATTQGESFGNIQGGRRYGQRDEGNYYAGYLQVNSWAEFQAALIHRTGLLDAALFGPPGPPSPPDPQPALRYASGFDKLDVDELDLTFEWAVDDEPPLARAKARLLGHAVFIEDVESRVPEFARRCYEELFEHTPALMRNRVYTPRHLADRLGVEREVHETDGDWNIFHWRYFTRALPQWRWSEHFGWGRSPVGALEMLTR